MDEFELAPPNASALVESLRGFGYTIGAALADIIDNSITAQARNIWIEFDYAGHDSRVRILDDGEGMNEDELRRAMLLGAANPLESRPSDDLGRFGLGLKTASFSQCRCLTVATKKDARIALRRWDLDYIARSGTSEWRLLKEARPDAEPLLTSLNEQQSGTMVLWQSLDRVVGAPKRRPATKDEFLNVTNAVEDHLAMVFQRFIQGPSPHVSIYLNRRKIAPWDPFLSGHAATEPTPVERIQTEYGAVELQGFILPHRDFLSDREQRLGAGAAGWAAHQGFYIYRADRLLVAGGWLGLGRPRPWTLEEPFRLARIRVDIQNAADADWRIDVKKSTARPPRALRPTLTALAQRVRERARRVFAHRGAYGKNSTRRDLVPVWEGRDSSSGSRYRISRTHPSIVAALESAPEAVEGALRLIEASVPIERIWLEATERSEVVDKPASEDAPEELLPVACDLVRHWMNSSNLSLERALEQLSRTDPFQHFENIAEQASRRLERNS